jgi:molecular chaperone HtpG
VADKLQELFNNKRDELEKKWEDLKVFIQYGIVSDEKFAEKAEKFFLFTNTEGKYFTMEEYEKLIKENQTDKSKQLVYLYATNKEEQYSSINEAREKGYDVLMMNGFLDPHFINYLEQKKKDMRFTRVDSDTPDNLIRKEDEKTVTLPENDQNRVRIAFEKIFPADRHFHVRFEESGENQLPVTITVSEYTRRMKDMAAMGGGYSFYKDMPDQHTFVVNASHPLIKEISSKIDQNIGEELKETEKKIAELTEKEKPLEEERQKSKEFKLSEEKEKVLEDIRKEKEETEKQLEQKISDFSGELKITRQLTDIAILAHGILKGEALNNFVKRSIELIDVDTTLKKSKGRKKKE